MLYGLKAHIIIAANIVGWVDKWMIVEHQMLYRL